MNTLFLLCALGLSLISHSQTPLFADHYAAADAKLAEMTLDEKIAQTLLVRYPDDETAASILEQYQFAGYVFFAKDFQKETSASLLNTTATGVYNAAIAATRNKTAAEVRTMVDELQKVAKVPILTAVDEEGGSVVRVSSNSELRQSPFLSPRELYQEGGLARIREDTVEKTQLLSSLGLNLNLAPVVDVSTNPADYMFSRSLGEDVKITSEFAKTVIKTNREENAKILFETTSPAAGTSKTATSSTTAEEAPTVSYILKHFPGYGNNLDTHQGTSRDLRSLTDLLADDLPPFRAGLDAGAEAVLVSHNIVTALDPLHPASLSPAVHSLLTDALGFTGVIITDDIAMGAITNPVGSTLSENPAVQAVLAGNHLIITTDYLGSLAAIKSAITRGAISESQIDHMARQVLAWKSYKGLF